jgi:hypothetical protein
MHQQPLHVEERGRAATIWIITVAVALLLAWVIWTFLKGSEHPGRNNPGVSSKLETVTPDAGELMLIAAGGRAG